MKTSDIILAGAVGVALGLAYKVGSNQGLKAAPEYLEAKRLADARHEDFWQKMADMETPEDVVCSRIFEMVGDLQAPRRAALAGGREPDPFD
ncbi:hypothetical protein [Cribrihabitans pelagius]|uniref:hypothetical protein n=1 Tax=Cribrihabitans pelagius TaxID=1765746 RepID=UPI003B59B778